MAKVRDGNSATLKGVKKNKRLPKSQLKKSTPNGKQNPSPTVATPPSDNVCFHAIAVNLKVVAEEMRKFNEQFAKASDG